VAVCKIRDMSSVESSLMPIKCLVVSCIKERSYCIIFNFKTFYQKKKFHSKKVFITLVL
jgi:hypothetical protein